MPETDTKATDEATKKDHWGLEAYSLENTQRMYAQADHWPLEDAMRLRLGLRPRVLAPSEEAATVSRRIVANLDLARNCLGHTLPEAPGVRADAAEARVRPVDALDWAKRLGITPPKALDEAVSEIAQEKGLAEPPGQPKTRQLTPKQIHRHRCAGIAALPWQQEPRLPIAQMTQRPELKTAGCGGTGHRQKTLKGWIRPEKPGGAEPGRPRKLT